MNKKKIWFKSLLAVAVLVILTVGICAVNVFAASEENVSEELNIKYGNLSFENEVHLMYAISSKHENVKLLVWEEAQTEYISGTEKEMLSPLSEQREIDGALYTVFKYKGLSAKQMADDVYVKAYIPETGEYGKTFKYSILQYAYNKLGKTGEATTNEKLIKMLNNMLAYGASAQEYQNYKTEALATDNFVEIKLNGGVFEDGFSYGLYKVGNTVKISAPLQNADGMSFAKWVDKGGNTVASSAAYTLTAGSANNTYTAAYASYSEGLEFESNGDGTCYLIGIGNSADTDIKIPPASSSGDTVIGIDRNAFAGEAITSVSIPVTVEEIGRNAFNNCTMLTDVYYDGSETDWALLDIATGNTAIENAKIHFAIVEKFTVTFVDCDGSVLKTETVKKGEAATAPEAPARDGYTFTGWDKEFGNITSDIEIVAQYEVVYLNPVFIIETVNATAGETGVEVTVSLKNNPGIASMRLVLSYADGLTLQDIAYNGEIGGMSQQPQTKDSPVIINWFNGAENSNGDWVFVTLTFDVSESAESGDYNITLDYDPNNVYDITETNIAFDVVFGKIVVS